MQCLSFHICHLYKQLIRLYDHLLLQASHIFPMHVGTIRLACESKGHSGAPRVHKPLVYMADQDVSPIDGVHKLLQPR